MSPTATPANTGGTVISWAISPTLPTGITIDPSTGEISGTPSVLSTVTSYTVTAVNTGGSATTIIDISVIAVAPTLSYNPENLTLTRGLTMNILNPIVGGGDIISWTINPAIPQGLSMVDGVISGTPLVNSTIKTYTITATNTGGSNSANINITILEPVAVIDYNPENLILTRGVLMITLYPTVSVGMVETWEIVPQLPVGLDFSDGVISGTPTVNLTLSGFTIFANNTGGTTFHLLNITINEPIGTLSYNPENLTLTRGIVMTNLPPTYVGGAVETWEVYPSLPTGMLFLNGVFSGNPSINSTITTYFVYANNSGGTAGTSINITIIESLAQISYVPENRTEVRTIAVNDWHPTVTGGMVETWEISPSLPQGLQFTNGKITGTPNVNSVIIMYTIWANNTGGSVYTNINLTIMEPVPKFNYSPENVTLIRGDLMTPMTPSQSGGVPDSWAITPSLPAGLLFNDGIISGTPVDNMTVTQYLIWANNTVGSASTSINITIIEPLATIAYNPSDLILTRGMEMEESQAEVTGGVVEIWAIEPSLPAGLSFTNGVISGTPTVNMTVTNYQIWANNSGGSASSSISITVFEPIANISYVSDNLTWTRGQSQISPINLNLISPINNGGMIASWSTSPMLPEGLIFANGTISGTPIVNSSTIMYTISVQNTGGINTININITILEPVAIIEYIPNNFELVKGETFINISAIDIGGMVALWEIEPTLPAGLVFNNGKIFGTPIVNSTLTNYTIWANNSGGSTSTQIGIKVLEPKAQIEYIINTYILINSVDSLLAIPSIIGGNPETWEFEPELPEGITFLNGVFSGTSQSNLSITTYTVWANNSGGSSFATLDLTINQPLYVARYPITILVLNISENMPVIEPIYYFDQEQKPVWSVNPALPKGLIFEDGKITGIPESAQDLTPYVVTVSGEMVPITFILSIEIQSKYIETSVQPVNNSNISNEIPSDLEPEPDLEPEDFKYWLLPILLILALWLLAILYNAKNKDEDTELLFTPEQETK